MAGAISITGMGIICAIGNDQQAVLDSLLKKESGIGAMKYLQSIHTDIPVGEIKLSTDEMKHMLGVVSDEPGLPSWAPLPCGRPCGRRG